jgi:hypothetical protein
MTVLRSCRLVPLLLAAGCYASWADWTDGTADGRDSADARPDASDASDRADAARDDATPDAADDGSDASDEHYWALVPVAAWIQAEACSYTPGQTAFVTLDVGLDRSCWYPGPAETALRDTPAGFEVVEVRAYVWEERGVRCDDIDWDAPYTFEVALPPLATGTWQIVDAVGASTTTIEVGPPPPPITCTDPGPAGADCLVDCDCQSGLVCGAARGDLWCGAVCHVPCNGAGDCGGYSFCTSDWTYTGRGCLTPTDEIDLCTGDGDCPPAMRCGLTEHGNRCIWDLELNGAIRHTCRVDEDCDERLDCVEHADGTRRCELRCTTPGMLCPPMHGCGMLLGDDGSRLWVCEWYGE